MPPRAAPFEAAVSVLGMTLATEFNGAYVVFSQPVTPTTGVPDDMILIGSVPVTFLTSGPSPTCPVTCTAATSAGIPYAVATGVDAVLGGISLRGGSGTLSFAPQHQEAPVVALAGPGR